VLTVFEARHTTNTDASTEDQTWARLSLGGATFGRAFSLPLARESTVFSAVLPA
jgi:hypothetical protein